MTMRMADIILAKRDGMELSPEQIRWVIQGCADGSIPDYQISAWLMAVYFSGMTDAEVSDMTLAMAESGDIADLTSIPGVKVDKHSTGGVGDKTTLIAGPIVAACGAPVAKMSGRGLGHTGGTIDKLEAIPGYKVELSRDDFLRVVRENGISVIGQSGNIAPADKKLYAIRDVTGTVDSLPLIASSVMSKKIAAGADAILLDVKTGRGAFMDCLDKSIRLAQIMVAIGEKSGKETIAIVSSMDEPLGFAVGNALEIVEVAETLKGGGPEDLRALSIELAANMLCLAGKAKTLDECRNIAGNALADGSAFARFKKMTAAQGGDTGYLDDPGAFTPAVINGSIVAERSGYVQSVDALAIGKASVLLGAGRARIQDEVDHSAGLLLRHKAGDWVEEGEELAELRSNSSSGFDEGRRLAARAFVIGESAPQPTKLILARVTAKGVEIY